MFIDGSHNLAATLVLMYNSYQRLFINPYTPGNAWVRSQHCGNWCPGAKAPGHQHPQCWVNIHCIGPISYRILHLWCTTLENKIRFGKKWPSRLRVNHHIQSSTIIMWSHKTLYCINTAASGTKLNQRLNSQKTPHTSPSRASYLVSFGRIWMKINCVITALHCTCCTNMSCCGTAHL